MATNDSDTTTDVSPMFDLLSTPTRVKILDVLLQNPHTEFRADEIQDKANITATKFYINVDALVDADLIHVRDEIRQDAIFQINSFHPFNESLGAAQMVTLNMDQS